jgi:acyl-CoA thioester hydrolase
MRAVGFPDPEGFAAHGCDTFAVNASANFRAPARYDDVLAVGVAVSAIGRTSFRCSLTVHCGDDLLVDGELVYVAGNLTDRRPVPVPQPFIDCVTTYEQVAPTRKYS